MTKSRISDGDDVAANLSTGAMTTRRVTAFKGRKRSTFTRRRSSLLRNKRIPADRKMKLPCFQVLDPGMLMHTNTMICGTSNRGIDEVKTVAASHPGGV
jgi:hypothetical protein